MLNKRNYAEIADADTRKCKSRTHCFECNKNHNKLLHFKKDVSARMATDPEVSGIFLATALVNASGFKGGLSVHRALVNLES